MILMVHTMVVTHHYAILDRSIQADKALLWVGSGACRAGLNAPRIVGVRSRRNPVSLSWDTVTGGQSMWGVLSIWGALVSRVGAVGRGSGSAVSLGEPKPAGQRDAPVGRPG